MKNLPGVFKAQKKNGDVYYRSSITFRSKHISLGSFDNEEDANAAYNDATAIIQSENTYLPDAFCNPRFLAPLTPLFSELISVNPL